MGIVYCPIKNLHFTIAAYQIKIDNRIIITGNLGNDAVGDAVPELQTLFAPSGVQTARFFTNAITTKTNGIDFVADYDMLLGDGKLNISLLYNYNKNKVADKLNNVPTAFIGQEDVYYGPQERSLIETNTPNHKGTLSFNYGINKFNFLLLPLGKKERMFFMDINLLFKIAAVGILAAVLHQVLVRAGREDQAMMTTLAGLVIVLSMVIQQISSLFNTVRTLFDL